MGRQREPKDKGMENPERDEEKTRDERLGGLSRGILLEIEQDVNILLYIEPTRQSEKVFPGEARASGAVSALSKIPPFFVKSPIPRL